MVGPPNSKASQKKMYFASEHVYANMNKLVQCYNTVKLYKNFVNITLFLLVFVRVITLVFKLLICNRAISRLKRLILALPLFLAKNEHYHSIVLSKMGAIYSLFRQKGTPLFRTFCQIEFLLWTEKPRFRPI